MRRFLVSLLVLVLIVVAAGVYDQLEPALTVTPTLAVAAEAPVVIVVPRPEPTAGPLPAAAEPPPARRVELAAPAPANRPPPPFELPDRSKLYLGNYFSWYTPDILTGELTAYRPPVPYDNEDETVLKRHIDEAISAGFDGFVTIWAIAKDRPDRNLGRLLKLSIDKDFRIGAAFLSNALPERTQQSLIGDLRYILGTYGGHPNYLKHEGKPVIVFNNMTQVPTRSGRPCASRNQCLQAWREIREEVELLYPAVWIGEGLDFTYLDVFDGIYLIKVTHAAFPNDYLKAPGWARQVRGAASITGAPKIWMATVMAGWDDTRTVGAGPDLREAAPAFRIDREDGAFLARTWQAALASAPDWVLLNGYNEWVEGTQIEPAVEYGNLYLEVSRQWADRFHASEP